MLVRSLHVYPVKGARGIALESADVLASGIRHDRRFLVLDAKGTFVTQRRHPRMALVETALSEHTLTLSVPSTRLSVTIDLLPLSSLSERRAAKIWDDEVNAVDVGGDGARFFSEHLEEECSLVYMPLDVIRQVDLAYAKPGDRVGFADGYPLLIASMSSLNDLNERLVASGAEAVPMDRFRPSVVVDGPVDPYAEDDAEVIHIGARLVLRTPKRCARCSVVTVDQRTSEASKEPLRTLAHYRTESNLVHFAMNAIPDFDGSAAIDAFEPIAVGDAVRFS